MGLFLVSGLGVALGQVQKELSGSLVKPARVDFQSKAYDYVEKGNHLFVAGKFQEAAAAYDDASEKDPDSPIPWLNGGLTSKERGRLGAAKLASNTAYRLGDRSSRGKVIAASIDIARKQFQPAKSKLEQALFSEPTDSYALSEYARWNLSQAHLREAERYFWQGFRDGSPIILDSKLIDQSKFSIEGGPRDGAMSYTRQTTGEKGSLWFDVGGKVETVGGSASQQLVKLDFAIDSPLGVLSTNYRSLQSDRPGISTPSLLLPTTPGSRLDFEHAMFGLQKRFSEWTFHASYRSENSDLRGGSAAPFLTDNHTTQWILESRFDRGPWMAGAGYSVVHRNASPTPGIEPLEAIFPNGITNMYNSYLVSRQMIGQNIQVSGGAIFTSSGGVEQFGIMGQASVHLIGNRYVRFGVKPGINRVQTNLGPISDMVSSLGSSGFNRLTGSTLEFNRDLAMPSLNSRITNVFLAYPLTNSTTITGFRTTFTNQNFMGSDPQLSPNLNLTPVKYGKVTGVSVDHTMLLSSASNLTLTATSQVPTGTYSGSTFDISSGNPVVTKESMLPNMANFEASASFDWSSKNATYALAARYLGPHKQAVTITNSAGLTPGTYFVPVGSGLNLEGHFSLALSETRSIEIDLYNLGGRSFYPGYRTSPQLVIGYKSRM